MTLAEAVPAPVPIMEIPEIGAKVMSVQPGASGKVRFDEKFRLLGEGLRAYAGDSGGILSIDFTSADGNAETTIECDAAGRWIDVTIRDSEDFDAGEHAGTLNVNAEDAEGSSVGGGFDLTVTKA